MEFEETSLERLIVIKPKIYRDQRGLFFESFNQEHFKTHDIPVFFAQDNQSLSNKNVLRGMHFQNPPHEQGKLVRVICGKVQDIVVDIRKSSKTYGSHFSIELSGENNTMMWIPPGFAHGFLALEDNTIFSYKCTALYNRDAEDCILWNDPGLGLAWQCNNPILSEKDQNGKSFNSFHSLF